MAVAATCHPSLAADDKTPDPPPAEQPVVVTPMERVDTTHERVSNTVEALAKRVDRFFGDERAFEEDNYSSLQISLDYIADEHDASQFDSRVRAKWVLPGTQQRLRLVLESDPQEAGVDSPESDPLRALDSPSDYIIGLEGETLSGGWQIRPSVGLRVDLPVDPYARVRAIRYFGLGSWLARVSSTAAWFKSDDTSLSANVDLDRRIGEGLLFRSATGVLWQNDPSLTGVGQMFSVYDQLASRAKVAYDLGATFDNNPDWRTAEYFVRLRYRRLFYSKWAYVEVQPKIGWPEENNYREELSLLLRLEVHFGRGYR